MKVLMKLLHDSAYQFKISLCFLGWPSEKPEHKVNNFTCRLLVNSPDDQEETIEEKAQRESQYEPMQVNLNVC